MSRPSSSSPSAVRGRSTAQGRTAVRGRVAARRGLRSVATLVVATAVAAGALLAVPGAALAAAPAQTTFVSEGFTGAGAGAGYVLPSAPSGRNVACLTAGSAPATPDSSIPGCGGTVDAAGAGALRLTTAALNETGGVGARQSVPVTKGIDAVFDSYQYNGRSDGSGTADGIVFYLAATDPYAPAVPTRIGQLGGSLGYSSARNGGPGLANAYLGIGLDAYGNFSAPGFGGADCATSPGRYPNAVTVRGPGSGNQGYCVVASTAGTPLGGTLSKAGVTDRSQARVPVQIVVNPTDGPVTSSGASAVTVAPGRFAVVYTPLGGTQKVLEGALPKLATSGTNAAGIPSSWVDPTTGYPYKLTYGWVAGTGGASDVHEVNYLRAQTAAGPVPVLTATAGGDASVPTGSRGTWTLTPGVSADGGTETQLVRATTVFPAGLTPDATAASGQGWSCVAGATTASGTTVTCDLPVPAGQPVQPGTALPALSVPYTATGAVRSASITSTVASTDAEAVRADHAVQVAPRPVTVTGEDAAGTFGGDVTLRATVADRLGGSGSSTPTGSVTFTDAASGAVLCTAPVLDGAASCTAPAGVVGERTVLVGYSGDATHAAVTGTERDALSLTVARAATAVALTVDPAETVFGTAARLVASGLPAAANGTVEFVEGDTVLCATTLPTLACDAPARLAAGDHVVTARYSGDESHEPALSTDRALTVTRAAGTVDAPPADPTGDTTVRSTHGDDVVLSTSGLPRDATGTVRFVTVDGTVLCEAVLPATSCTVPGGLPGGEHVVRATWSGDRDHLPVEGQPFTLAVAPEDVPLAPVVDEDGTVTGTVGDPVRLAVTGIPEGATGTVTFTDADGTVLCTVELPGTGCDVSTLPAGTTAVTATYSGDRSHAAATTGVTVSLAKRVVAVTPAAPVVSATEGRRVRLAVPALPEGATGTVTFTTADGTVLCSVELPEDGCDVVAPAVGTWTVTATYGGDAVLAASSATFELAVAAAPVAAPEASDGSAMPVAPAATPAPAAGGAGTLAFTGTTAGTGLGVLLAAAALALGALLVGRRRRRRDGTSVPRS